MAVVLKQNTGIDVDSKKLKVNLQFLLQGQKAKIKGSRTFNNSTEGFKKLTEWVDKKRNSDLPMHYTIEATGVYYENLAYYLDLQVNTKVHVVLPNTSSAYFKSLNQKTKTDEVDAASLALMGLERDLLEWTPSSPVMRTLKKLSRERIRINEEKTLVSNQLHAENHSHSPEKTIVNRFKERILFLKTQIIEVEKEMMGVVKSDEELNSKVKNILKVKGLGIVTIIGVISEMNGFALFKNRAQVISFTGYDVVQKQSGTSIQSKPRISKKGNSFVRKMLYFPAITAVKYNEHHKTYYTRIVDKSNIKMKGYVAIQRKLLLLIYTLYTKNQPYDPTYYIRKQEELKLRTEANASKKASTSND